jgi:outer membrane assembly lipoprotein YfiO
MALMGCWSTSSSPEPDEAATEEGEDGEAKELSAGDSSAKESDNKPQAELARIAKRLYQSKMYSVSRDSLQSLGNQGASGAYRAFAEVKLADSYFFNGEHNEASKRYEEFAKNYPSSAEVPYAKLQAARSYLALARGAGRDRKPLESALVLFDDLVKRYPDSDYGAIAAQARVPVIKELAAYDQGIIDFYERLGNTAAVAERKRAFDTQWEDRLRATSATQTSAAEKRLLPLLPVAHQALTQEVAEITPPQDKAGITASAVERAASPITVRQITCRRGSEPYAILNVDRVPDALTKLGSYEAAPSDTGLLTMSGLGLRSPRSEFNCFGTKDLRITPEGNMELRTSTAMVITALDAPPRLLLSRVP